MDASTRRVGVEFMHSWLTVDLSALMSLFFVFSLCFLLDDCRTYSTVFVCDPDSDYSLMAKSLLLKLLFIPNSVASFQVSVSS